MKTTAGKPTFKGTKASKDFFKDETKIEAPGKLPCRDTLYELQLTDFKVMARPYAQVAKSGTTSGFTNTLVQAAEPFPNMATGSKIRAQPLAPSSQPGSYAGVTSPPVALLAGTQTLRSYLPDSRRPPRLRRGLYPCRVSPSPRLLRSLHHWRSSNHCVFLGIQKPPPRRSRKLRRSLPLHSSSLRMRHLRKHRSSHTRLL
jgi:hypothetical protein